MRTIGLLGGMSWESTAEYYRLINRGVREARGPTASARLVLYSFDFAEIERLQRAGDWRALRELLTDAACRVASAGADFLLLCTNTMHVLADEVAAAARIPLVHIADATASAVLADGCRQVSLLGTAFTMDQAFYRERLEAHGLIVTVPPPAEREEVSRIIYTELVAGEIRPASREAYRAIIARQVEAGAQGVILGCTEIPLLVRPHDSAVPLYDTTAIHARAAVRLALGDEAPAPAADRGPRGAAGPAAQ